MNKTVRLFDMKTILTIVMTIFASATAFSQSYFSPESIEFDYANNRWFIANNGGNNILTRSSATGVLSIFAPNGFAGGGPHGLEIVEDTLYACAGASLRAYNINSGALVFARNLGATFLNGITHDTSGNLYITDFSGNKIYRFNTKSRKYNVFVSGGVTSPNGIIYDQENNRCVFVQWSGAIRTVSLVDSTVSTLVASSGLSSIDGITRDGTGNYYLSSWSPTRITRYNSTFTSPTVAVGSGMGLSNPADIFYNVQTDSLGVPNSGSGNNTTYYYFGSTTSIKEISDEPQVGLSVVPNPSSGTSQIHYQIAKEGHVQIEVFDISRKLVKKVVSENQSKGAHVILFEKADIPAGVYFITLSHAGGTLSQKVVITE